MPDTQAGPSGTAEQKQGREAKRSSSLSASSTPLPLDPGPQGQVPDARSPIPAVRIDLHIEELVLQGFNRLDQAELGAKVQEALSQLIAERGIPAAWEQGAQVDVLDGGAITIQPDAGASDMASQIARAIYRGLEP